MPLAAKRKRATSSSAASPTSPSSLSASSSRYGRAWPRQRLEERFQLNAQRKAQLADARHARLEALSRQRVRTRPAAARHIQRAWRQRVPTSALLRAFRAPGLDAAISTSYASQDEAFEAIAPLVQAPATVNAAAHLVCRLEATLPSEIAAAARERCAPLVAKMGSPKRTTRRGGLSARMAPAPAWHPTRVLLSAYMIVGAPEAVMGGEANGEARDALAASARRLTEAMRGLKPGARSAVAFEGVWTTFLAAFDAWKRADAAALEADLTRAACAISASATLKLNGRDVTALPNSSDLRMLADGAKDDVAMLRSKAANVGGVAGAARFDAAVEEAKRAAAATVEREQANGTRERPKPPSDGIDVPGLGHVPRDRMIYELLHDPDFRLPAPSILRESEESTAVAAANPLLGQRGAEALVAARRAARDTIAQALRDAPSAEHAGQHLLALADDVFEAALDSVGRAGKAGEVCARGLAQARNLLPDKLVTDDEGEAAAERAVATLTPFLDRASSTLCALGAPAREPEIEAAMLAACSEGDIAGRAAAAFEVLHRSACAIGVDSTNAGLGALAAALGHGAGAEYVLSRFADEYGLPQRAIAPEPRRRASSGSSGGMAYSPAARAAAARSRAGNRTEEAPDTEQALRVADALPVAAAFTAGAIGLAQDARAKLQPVAAARASVPMHMQAGRALTVGQLMSNRGSSADARVTDAASDKWWCSPSAALRFGALELAAVAAREGSLEEGAALLAAEALPEPMRLDDARIIAVADVLRRVAECAAALLAAKQARAAARRAPLSPEALGPACERALALLRSPSATHADVATELARAVDGDGSGASAGIIERLLRHHMEAESGGAIAKRCFEAARLGARALLGLGPSAGMDVALAALGTTGAAAAEAGALLEELCEAAALLERLSALQLAVHGETYAAIFEAQHRRAEDDSSEGEM